MMMPRDQIPDRQISNAKKMVLGDIIFIVLPFVFLFFIELSKNTLSQILDTTDWALAATILSGQTLIRYYFGLMDLSANKPNANLYGIGLLCLTLLSLLIYAILHFSGGNVIYFKVFQIVLFIIILYIALVYGSVGYILNDIKK